MGDRHIHASLGLGEVISDPNAATVEVFYVESATTAKTPAERYNSPELASQRIPAWEPYCDRDDFLTSRRMTNPVDVAHGTSTVGVLLGTGQPRSNTAALRETVDLLIGVGAVANADSVAALLAARPQLVAHWQAMTDWWYWLDTQISVAADTTSGEYVDARHRTDSALRGFIDARLAAEAAHQATVAGYANTPAGVASEWDFDENASDGVRHDRAWQRQESTI